MRGFVPPSIAVLLVQFSRNGRCASPARMHGLFCLLMTLCVLPLQAGTLDCIRHDRFAHIVGGTSLTMGPVGNVWVVPPYAYIGARDTFSVVDISNPHAPTVVGQLPHEGWIQVADATTTQALIGGSNGLELIDLRDPRSPRVQQRVPDPERHRGWWHKSIHGDAIIAVTDNWVLVFRVSTNTLVDSLRLPNMAGGAASAGDRLYILTQDFSLRVVDLTNPFQPLLRGSLMRTVRGGYMTARGNFAYIVSGEVDELDLEIIDATDPDRPVGVGNLTFPGHVTEIGLSGDRLIVEDSDRVLAVDVAEPSRPRYLGQLLRWPWIVDVGTAGPWVLVGLDSRLLVLDASKPILPELLWSRTPAEGTRLAIHETRAYVASRVCFDWPQCHAGFYPKVQVLSLIDPLYPHLLTQHTYNQPVSAATADVAADAQQVVWLGGDSAILMQCQPSVVSGVKHQVVAHGGYFLAGGDSLATIVCRSNFPAVSWRGFPGPVRALAVDGDRAYLACESAGLQVVDISNPSMPRLLGGVAWPHDALQVAVSANRAYVADSGSGLQVIDVTDDMVPRLQGRAWSPVVGRIAADAGSVYMAAGNLGILVFDVSNPELPNLVQTMGMSALDVELYQGAVCAATGSYLDVFLGACDLATSILVQDLDARPTDDGIEIRWHSEADERFQVLRAAGPAATENAVILGSPTDSPRNGYWAFLDREVEPGATYAYWIETISSLGQPQRFGPVVATAVRPQALRLRIVGAHPARGSALIEYHLRSAGNARIECFDLAGRLVRRLELGVTNAGRHSTRWDGLDHAGRSAASGVYHLRLQSSGQSITTRIVLMSGS